MKTAIILLVAAVLFAMLLRPFLRRVGKKRDQFEAVFQDELVRRFKSSRDEEKSDQ